MAVKYNTPTSALPTDWDYSSDSNYHEYWVDFKEKALQGEWATALNSKFNDNFGEATKDWTVEDYRNWAEASGFTESIKKGLPSDYQQWTNLLASDDVGGIQRVIGALVMDKKGKFTAAKWETSSSDIAAVVDGMRSYGAQKDLVTNLREKGGTDEQIQGILNSRDGSTEGFESFLNDVEDLQGEDWESYVVENFAEGEVLPENSWGDETTGFQIPQAEIATQNPPDPVELAENAVTNFTFGPSDINTLLQNDGYIGDGERGEEGKYYTADGREVVKNSAGRISYVDSPDDEWTPEGTGVEAQTEVAQEQKEAAEEVVSDAVETTGQAVDTAAGIESAYVGGDVSPEAANALGWTKNPDGTYTDPANKDTVWEIKDGVLVNKNDPTQTATTKGMMNFEENDFAGRNEDIINTFLYGAQVTPENAQDYGFSFDPNTNTYTSPDGTRYVDAGGQLQDENGVPIERSHGFTDYQSDLEGAAEEYTQQMTGLRSQYDQTFNEYGGRLEPYLQQQEDITSGLMDVASDAGDENYYSRLKDVYFADAAEGIQSDADSSRDQVQQMYARSGADPNSPAYTAAIMDLQEKRGDAMRSARRQALLDSYSLGNNMLQNRSSTLSNAQTGVGNSMNALGGLYDVKIKGLEVDRDMVSEIYKGKQNQANIGVQGLNTVAGQQQNILNTDKDTFFKELDLRTGLNQNTQSSATNAANTAGAADVNATNDMWTNVNWMQTLAENDMNWRATGAAMQTQFPDYDFKGSLDPKLYNQLFPEGT